MKVFKIPVWDNDSGVTHESTTWQLATDSEFKNIITEVVDSTKYLNYWAVNVVVPKGKIYYVRSQRKFKEVDNKRWIGPKKVINDDAGLSEIIKPEMKIDDPYISNINLDYEKGLTITLSPYKGNVPHESTTWLIRDMETGKLLYKSMYDTKNQITLNIKPKEIDFSNIPYIVVTTLFHGKLGVESSPSIETIEVAKKYYSIVANKKIAPSEENYTGSIKQETVRTVTLKKANLFLMDDKLIAGASIKDNKFVFDSKYLIPDMSYTVKLYLTFDNNDKTMFVTSYSFFTKTISEKVVFNSGRKYNELDEVEYNNACLVIDTVDNDTNSNGLLEDVQMLTEEFYIGVIPMLGKDKQLKSYFFSRNDHKINYIKNLSDFKEKYGHFIKCELTPSNKLYIDTVVTEKDGKGEVEYRTMYVYDFNPYNQKMKYLATIKRDDEVVTDINTNAYGVLNGEFYWASIDKSDNTKVLIRKIDKDTNKMVTLVNKILDTSVNVDMDNILFARTTEDRFMIIPQYYNTDKEFFGFVYDVSKNETYKLFTIPIEIRTQHVVANTLDNGDVLIKRTQLENGKLYYGIIDGGESKTITTKYTEPMIDNDIELKNNIKLKSGNVLSIGFKNQKGTMTLWD